MFGIQVNGRGQVTVEFMAVVITLMLVFLFAFHYIGSERGSTAQLLWNLDGRDRARMLGEQVNAVVVEGPGANRTLTMPARLIGGVNYTIKVYPRMVAVDVPAYGREFTWRLLTSNINGSDTVLVLAPGRVTIENVEKTIYMRSV